MKAPLITAIIVSVGAALFFSVQQSRVDSASERLALLEAEIKQLKADYPGIETGQILSKSTVRSESNDQIDEAKVKAALEALTAEIKSISDAKLSVGATLRKTPEILDIIDDLTSGEFFALIDQLEVNMRNEAGATISFLLVSIAAEADPMRMLEGTLKSPQMQMQAKIMAFGVLVRKDPYAAEQWFLAQQNEENASRENGWARDMYTHLLGNALLTTDPKKAISFMRDAGYESSFSFGDANTFTLEQGKEIARALSEEDNDEIKGQLVGRLLKSHLNSGGAGSIIETLKTAYPNRKEGDLMATLHDHDLVDSVRDSQTADELLAISQELIGKPDEKIATNIVSKWVERDFNGAGEWIQSMDESPAKQEAIKTFASRITDTDPETAIAWYQSLDDQRNTQSYIKKVVNKWGESDKEAAEAWAKENDFNVGHLR